MPGVQTAPHVPWAMLPDAQTPEPPHVHGVVPLPHPAVPGTHPVEQDVSPGLQLPSHIALTVVVVLMLTHVCMLLPLMQLCGVCHCPVEEQLQMLFDGDPGVPRLLEHCSCIGAQTPSH